MPAEQDVEELFIAIDYSDEWAAYATQGAYTIHVNRILEIGGKYGVQIQKNGAIPILEAVFRTIHEVHPAIAQAVPELTFPLVWKSVQYPYK